MAKKHHHKHHLESKEEHERKKEHDVKIESDVLLPENSNQEPFVEVIRLEERTDPIYKVEPLLKRIPKYEMEIDVSSKKTLPQSLKLLEHFAEKEGYKGMGEVSNQKGNKYIGRKETLSGETQLIEVYPRVEIKNGETPDILTNYRYFAGKAINSWNEFVKDEYNFLNFAKEISSPEKAKNYLIQKIKYLTTQTFQAQLLATLTYFYIRLPQEEIFRKNFLDYTNDMNDFFDNYSMTRPRENPLFLSLEEAKEIALILLSFKGPIPLAYLEIYKFMEKIWEPSKLQIQRENLTKALNYVTEKVNETKTCYENMGIEESQINSVLSIAVAYEIRKMKTLFPSIKKNNEVKSIIQRVINERSGVTTNVNEETMTEWNINLTDHEMPCHNYVF